MTHASNILDQYTKDREARKQESIKTLLSLTEQLTAAGIGLVLGFFDGSGDSGQMEGVFCFPADAAEDLRDVRDPYEVESDDSLIPLPALPITAEQLEEELWELTPDGFVDNEGGFGCVFFNVAAQKIRVNYSYRFEDAKEADYEVL